MSYERVTFILTAILTAAAFWLVTYDTTIARVMIVIAVLVSNYDGWVGANHLAYEIGPTRTVSILRGWVPKALECTPWKVVRRHDGSDVNPDCPVRNW